MSSGFPPQVKEWVQTVLARATPSNKASVNAELKKLIFDAFRDGTIGTTDWTKVEIQALKGPALPATPVPTYYAPPPPPAPPAQTHSAPQSYAAATAGASYGYGQGVGYGQTPQIQGNGYGSGNASGSGTVNGYSYVPPTNGAGAGAAAAAVVLGGHSLGASSVASSSTATPKSTAKAAKQKKETEGKKRKREKTEASTKFPSAYVFASDERGAVGEDDVARAKRLARFAKPAASASDSGRHATPGINDWFEDERSHPVKVRLGLGGSMVLTSVEPDENVLDWDHLTIKGTSTRLEKSYLRLTSEPSPADIRPLKVLTQTLAHLKKKWKDEHNYAYALDQFKSMRQDLTVQRIKNDFTVEVYEIHARIALEAKDLGEYNQCQTMLRQLYDLGLNGCKDEFKAYRIMYYLHTKNRSVLAKLTPTEKDHPGIAHALQTAAAIATSNYARFFTLFENAPNMSGYIMDHFVERERMSALVIMSKAYLSLSLQHLAKTLAFDNNEEADAFLTDHAANLYTNPTVPRPLAQPNASVNVSVIGPQRPGKPTPLAERVWDARKAHAACVRGLDKFRVVDLKGQVDAGVLARA